MAKNGTTAAKAVGETRRYYGANIPLAAIRRYARQIAERFQPDKIILFGSHAYGTPHEDSDVDLLVVMPAYNELSKAARIRWEIPAPFPMDLIVRTPAKLQMWLNEDESFHSEIVSKGKFLYEKGDAKMDSQGRRRLSARLISRRSR